MLGLQFGALLSGAVITEYIFSWPGIGSLTVEAIYRRDYPLVQGCVLVIAVSYLGDTVLTMPLCDALQRRWPEAQLDVWCRTRCRDLFTGLYPVERLIVSDAVPADRTRESGLPAARRREHLRLLREQEFDLVVDASRLIRTRQPRSATICS